MHAVYTPVWEQPATFPYCCPITVLEWKVGHDIILPPVAKLETLIAHRSASQLEYGRRFLLDEQAPFLVH